MNRNASKIRCKRGFTLIELLVVVLIIGILAAVAVPQYQKAVEKSRLTEALQNLREMQTCMELYKLENGLPTGDNQVLLKDMNCPIEPVLGEEVGHSYYSTKFRYFGDCRTSGCTADVYPHSVDYELVYDGEKSLCYTQDTDMGRYICGSLKNQGFEYVDEEF